MRAWRRQKPQGPSTGTRWAATARRMLNRVKKKKVVKNEMIIQWHEAGQRRAPQAWKRYQKTPVTWNGPSRRRTRPGAGECGEAAGAAFGGADAAAAVAAPAEGGAARGAVAAPAFGRATRAGTAGGGRRSRRRRRGAAGA